jgi:NADH-quinone oxidoreductase subunit E
MAARRLAETQPDSFAFTAENRAWAEREIGKFPAGRQASAVISLLWRAQEQEGWVTRPAIEGVAAMLDMPLIRVLEVATFYTMFHLEPVGSNAHIQVCGTTPCMLRGAGELIDICRERIHHEPHHRSEDGRLSWEEVECLGACVNAPMIQVSKDTYEDLTPELFASLIEAFARGERPAPGPQNGRHHSMPITGATSLREIAYAEDDVRPARAAAGGIAAHPGAGRAPAPPPDAGAQYAGSEMQEVQKDLRAGRGPGRSGGTDPATTRAANQQAARVDTAGRSDEAAARSPGASAGAPPKPAEDTHESGPRNPGPQSDRDTNDPAKGR